MDNLNLHLAFFARLLLKICFHSFESNLLDGEYYTRPEDFRGLKVPEVLNTMKPISPAPD